MSSSALNVRLETLLKAPLYKLEQIVAGQQIPKIPKTQSRLRFEDLIAEGKDEFDHTLWDDLLKAYVKDGCVDYASMRDDTRLSAYLKKLEDGPVPTDPLDRLAFHINAYNALCANFVVQNPEIKSILELSKPNQPIWDQTAGRLAGVEISLNQIEHDRLRGEWDEPAIHACIVCASQSCPDLRDAAYLPKDLQTTMYMQIENWLRNSFKGSKTDSDSRLYLSRIFLWFESDFDSAGGVLAFVNKFNSDISQHSSHPAVRYFEYDWSLNSRRK